MTTLKNCLNYILGGGRGQPIRVVDDTQQLMKPLGSGLLSCSAKMTPTASMQLGNDKISTNSQLYVTQRTE